MNKLLMVVGIVLIVGLGYLHYDSQQQLKQARQQMFELKIQVEELKQQISVLEQQVKTLDDSSVQGIVREANSAILDGWQSLVKTVESEIKKARESLETDKAPPASQP